MTSCAGILVVTAVGTASAAGILAALPDTGVLILWGAGAGVLWRAVRKDPHPLPSPTGVPPVNDKRAGQRIAHSGGVVIVYPSDITQQTGRTLPGPSIEDKE